MANQPVQNVSETGDKIKVLLAVCAVIAGIVAFYVLSGKPTIVRVGGLLAGLLAAVALAWTSHSGRSFIGFAGESWREVKKVVWPTSKETVQMTAVVFGFVVVMAIFLWGTDKVVGFLLYDLILGWRK